MKPLPKVVYILLLIIGTVVILYYGKSFLVPLAFGSLFAMLFTPVKHWLMDHGIPRIGAILLCLLSLLLIFGLFFVVILWQGHTLAQDWPQVQEEITKKGDQLEDWAIQNIGIVSEERIQKIKENFGNQKQSYIDWIKGSMGSVLDAFVQGLLAVVYMVFLMLVSRRLHDFILRIVPDKEDDKAEFLMESARDQVSSYFFGRLILVGILAVLYAVGFSIFGLKYAIPIGLLAGVVTFIPYIGNIIGGGMALLIALATGGDSTVLFGVLGTMTLVQVMENYVLEPWIVGSEVSLNPFFTFVSIIAFSLIWGIAGTILAIPIVAILKTIFDHVDPLEPFGFVMGIEETDS